MDTLYKILGLAGAGLVLFILYQMIKNRPELFQKEHLNKSFLTMGILALALIGFVALLVLILRTS